MVRSRHALPVVLLAAALVLGACGDDEPETLPDLGSAPSASDSSAAEQAVRDRVQLYTETVDAISAGAKVDMKRLRAVAVDDWAQTVGQNLQQVKARDYVVTGKVTRTFKSVSVTGDTAEYVHCVDQRKTRLVKDGVPEPDGPVQTTPPSLSNVTLVKQSGVWKVQKVKGGGKC